MNFLSKLSGKERIGVAAAVAVVSLVFLDRFVVSPIAGRIGQLNKQIKLEERQLGRRLADLKSAKEIKGAEGESALSIKMSGSDEEEMAKTLSEIEKIARSSSLTLSDIKPQAPKASLFYHEFSVEINIEGAISEIIDFLHQINNSPQLLRTEKVVISRKQSDKEKDKESAVLDASILVSKIAVAS